MTSNVDSLHIFICVTCVGIDLQFFKSFSGKCYEVDVMGKVVQVSFDESKAPIRIVVTIYIIQGPHTSLHANTDVHE